MNAKMASDTSYMREFDEFKIKSDLLCEILVLIVLAQSINKISSFRFSDAFAGDWQPIRYPKIARKW